MSELPEPSRTFFLERDHIRALSSFDDEETREAVLELPDALTRQEVQDIGHQINLSTGLGKEAIKLGRELEREALFNIGNFLIHLKDDVVSTRNVARELRSRGMEGFIGYLVLSHAIRQKTKQIIQDPTDPETYE